MCFALQARCPEPLVFAADTAWPKAAQPTGPSGQQVCWGGCSLKRLKATANSQEEFALVCAPIVFKKKRYSGLLSAPMSNNLDISIYFTRARCSDASSRLFAATGTTAPEQLWRRWLGPEPEMKERDK